MSENSTQQVSKFKGLLEGLYRSKGSCAADIGAEVEDFLRTRAKQARINSIIMTSVANSGHPAGSLSSIEMCLMAYGAADLSRDKIVVSHGHVSPAVYSSIALWDSEGLFNADDMCAHFRELGSPYTGHVERTLRGVDWSTGNLGQGLSAGVGFSLAHRARKIEGSQIFVLMGDGEQVKGQLAESRRIAIKEKLSNITVMIDVNDIQICGNTRDVMSCDIEKLWRADGWDVTKADGHGFNAILKALIKAQKSDTPTAILCRTVMGKGVSFMECVSDYHGKAAAGGKIAEALAELGADISAYDNAKAKRLSKDITIKPFYNANFNNKNASTSNVTRTMINDIINIDTGEPRTYTDNAGKTDNRSAFGNALLDMGKLNCGVAGKSPILAFDCDLEGSVKLDKFAAAFPENFIEGGIQEHAVATIAGAASTAGVVSVWADFGVFGISEVYNQHRLNDINKGTIKLALTHVGLDVGEDGMTHQCIDYAGLLKNTFGWKVVVPADPNLTDRVTRWAFAEPSCVCIAMGRSAAPVILKDDGTPFFGGDYSFKYGDIDEITGGKDGTILALGIMLNNALSARKMLIEKGYDVKVLHTACPIHLDTEKLISLIRGPLITIEDHHVKTGLGATVALELAGAGHFVPFAAMGVHRYGDSANSADATRAMGLEAADIVNKFLFIKEKVN